MKRHPALGATTLEMEPEHDDAVYLITRRGRVQLIVATQNEQAVRLLAVAMTLEDAARLVAWLDRDDIGCVRVSKQNPVALMRCRIAAGDPAFDLAGAVPSTLRVAVCVVDGWTHDGAPRWREHRGAA